ncbi:modular serine protease-like [Chrysoperla carnea]|uniref:modular serine protease-like n=1 Tax=Chrysoperla carnea TaxID=189513 RepID=UPI001D07552C|nr:modular serine protease-like [Chrysoperla carnea]
MGAIHKLWFCVYFITLSKCFDCQKQCKEGEFSCGGEECIPKALVCDGKYDCSNIEDEAWQVCETNLCNVTQFHCAYGACIPLSAKCNKIFDCVDGSDEEYCEIKTMQKCPKKWMVSCLSGECIRQDQMCDGIKDCVDNSDETFSTCSNFRCPEDTFKCHYGACVDLDVKCNGIRECVDYSDELLPECKIKLNITLAEICGENSFRCNSGLCIKKEQLCDGVRHCDDGSDETIGQCKHSTCLKKRRCNYGPCSYYPRCGDEFSSFVPKQSTIHGGENRPSLPGNLMTPECHFPSQPENGNVMTNTGTIPKPNEIAPTWTILIYTCNKGYSLGTAQSVLVCMNGQWTNPIPKCLKTCPALKSENHEIECKLDGKIIPCEQACEGTVANIKCKESLDSFIYQPYNGIECNDTGKWSNELFDCNPACGKLIPKAKALVIHGYTAAKGEFPWHAGIYKRDSVEDDSYEQICGGTLISEKVIVSAAHCFWDWNENKPNMEIKKYSVAVGKFYRTWNNTKDKDAQYSELQRIILPNKFRAEESSFANDIAILILNKTIKFTPRVRPVCVDWGNELYKILLKPGALGTVAGWGLTEEFGFASEELQAVRMPYVEYDTCVSNLPDTFRPFITNDKICAGYNNGTSICTGDSGGGITFKKSNRYFIEGVVSVAPAKGATCDSYQYVAFTSVPQHLDFIMEIDRKTN